MSNYSFELGKNQSAAGTIGLKYDKHIQIKLRWNCLYKRMLPPSDRQKSCTQAIEEGLPRTVRRVALVRIDVSEELIASIFRMTRIGASSRTH
jgi:hypothetical protein